MHPVGIDVQADLRNPLTLMRPLPAARPAGAQTAFAKKACHSPADQPSPPGRSSLMIAALFCRIAGSQRSIAD
jgi:hypothetical protein